jgi:outer membrane biogenesis lipoprotein LolB
MTSRALLGFSASMAVCVLLAACAATERRLPEKSSIHGENSGAKKPQQLNFQLSSGIYRCEAGQNVGILRDARNANSIRVDWQGNRHELQRLESTSGLPRYEDAKKELVWIDLPWKGVLLDAGSGRPLANDCKAMN